MTQPDIINWDQFPEPEVSEIDRLTAAIHHHAAAVNNLAAEIEIARNAGSLQPPAERRTAALDPRIERVQPDTVEAEEFWADFGVDIHQVHAALGGLAGQAVAVEIKKTLEDVPEGGEAVLDPPRLLPKEAAIEADILVGYEVWVRKVWRESVDNEYAWSFWEKDEADDDAPWGAHTKQIEALGLTYEDFSAPRS